jgi:hypothetical protein
LDSAPLERAAFLLSAISVVGFPGHDEGTVRMAFIQRATPASFLLVKASI